MSDAVRESIRDFIIENFLFGNKESRLEDSQSLGETGVIDSAGVLSLIMFLEEKFGLQVLDEEVVPDNLDSVDKLTTYVKRKKGLAE